uniref:Non-specific serine/threonine protein kinase n=1 Tax=Rhabditophanes sp. KR3021 TaxID=114890 RepID=A0AC35TIE8_9BILA
MASFKLEVLNEIDSCESGESGLESGSSSAYFFNSGKNPFFANLPDHETVAVVSSLPVINNALGGDETPTTIQKALCLNATSYIETHLSSDDECDIPVHAKMSKIPTPAPVSCPCVTPEKSILIKSSTIPTPLNLNFPCHTRAITDDYEISHEIIGIGESGKVMACYSKPDGRKFALKVLRDSPKARREVGIHYLTNSHPNVVSISDIYENTFQGVKCLLMVVEFLEGGDLLSKFENSGSIPYSEQVVGDIAQQIGEAVKYLHSLNIAHRDIKLENILCGTSNGKSIYKLADFGFAKRQEINKMLESPCCTYYYVPPEVLKRERYDKSCDMWSLGVALYILLCAYPPFYSMGGSPLSPGMKSRISQGCYNFPEPEWGNITEGTKNVIRNLLKTDPSSRTKIDAFMNTGLVTGKTIPPHVNEPKATYPTINSSSMYPNTDVYNAQIKKFEALTASKAFVKEKLMASRLHSIQEEVGRALDSMRLGNDTCYVKALKTSQNGLLSRRQQSMLNQSNIMPKLSLAQ